MQTSKQTLSPTRVKLTVEVPFDELKPNVDAAYKRIAQQVRVAGFRPGQVPPRVLDQRVGRGAVLDEALQEALPQLYSRPSAGEARRAQPAGGRFTEFADGASLASPPRSTSVRRSSCRSTRVLRSPSPTSRPATRRSPRSSTGCGTASHAAAGRPSRGGGRLLSIDLSASVDGEPVPGAEATGLSYEVGKDSLILGLDDAIPGARGGERTFDTELVAGDYAGRTAEVTVTVRSVKAKELPELDDDFATTASEFDTLAELRGTSGSGCCVKKLEQGVQARDRVLEKLLDAVDIELPVPDVLGRDRRAHSSLVSSCAGRHDLENYLETEGKPGRSSPPRSATAPCGR